VSDAPVAHLGIRELAIVAARAIAVETVLFEAFGRWIATTSEASAKPALAAASQRHARHVELWRERFPVIPDADLDQSVAAARSDLGPLVDAIAAFDGLPSGPGRLAVVDVASSALTLEYRAAPAAVDRLVDAPTVSVLTLIVADLDAAPSANGELSDAETAALATLVATPFPPLLAR
jgi:hypothetical protein